ncbi:Cysteine--tRNA ligase [Frankliniella fusca]|uniref:Cysteine--tRNA ligase n=1 Tax=Frankliniella fusca TaxID=407009 RepID=A0AAE1HL84_9NEOP|nr:Cysteine--tRNA ligase [Frankliniella fusca]
MLLPKIDYLFMLVIVGDYGSPKHDPQCDRDRVPSPLSRTGIVFNHRAAELRFESCLIKLILLRKTTKAAGRHETRHLGSGLNSQMAMLAALELACPTPKSPLMSRSEAGGGGGGRGSLAGTLAGTLGGVHVHVSGDSLKSLKNIKTWLSRNMLLLATLVGVAFGVLLGE